MVTFTGTIASIAPSTISCTVASQPLTAAPTITIVDAEIPVTTSISFTFEPLSDSDLVQCTFSDIFDSIRQDSTCRICKLLILLSLDFNVFHIL